MKTDTNGHIESLVQSILEQRVKEKPRPKKNQIGQYFKVHQDIAAKLKEEAENNAVFNSFCNLLALRERSRKRLTVKNLSLVMEKEGFNYSRIDYEYCYRCLASLGVGSLEIDSKNRVKALSDIKFSLPHLGLAALGKNEFVMPRVASASYKQTKKPHFKNTEEEKLVPEIPKVKPVEPPDKYVEIKIQVFDRTFTIKKTSSEAVLYLLRIIEEISHDVR